MSKRKISLCKKYVDATFCEQRAKRVLRMRYCMSKHITVSHTSNFKGENVFEKSDQISYSCKAGNPHTSIFKVENIFEKSDQISYSCKAEIHIYQFSKWKKFLINLIKSHTPVKLKSTCINFQSGKCFWEICSNLIFL